MARGGAWSESDRLGSAPEKLALSRIKKDLLKREVKKLKARLEFPYLLRLTHVFTLPWARNKSLGQYEFFFFFIKSSEVVLD